MPFSAVLLILSHLAGPASARATAERELYVMGTLLRGRVEAASRVQAEAALESALSEIERWEGLLSTWDPTTPVSALNDSPAGSPVALPAELASVLAEAFAWSERTGGAFDPTVGALVDAWDLRGEGRRPDGPELSVALGRVGPATFSVEAGRHLAHRITPGAWLDTGGFGKGVALRAAARQLRAHGATEASLDLGGQLLVVGFQREPLQVAVAHPTRRHEPAAWLRLSDASVATSGNSERGVHVDGALLGHILDPRTGLPTPNWGSVTVVSADPFEADVLSTALYVMGPEAGLAWAEARDDVGVLFLVAFPDGTLQTLSNQAMSRWLTPSSAPAGHPQPSSPERRLP